MASLPAIGGDTAANTDAPGGIEQEGSAAAAHHEMYLYPRASAASRSSSEGDKMSRAIDQTAQACVIVKGV
ncbi:MAG TPA: hypothetical protein VFM04_03050 [Candidatus Methylomirabilis sp.]|nr:hypothetical protein [Candidatus Methylomirabilis sp.]